MENVDITKLKVGDGLMYTDDNIPPSVLLLENFCTRLAENIGFDCDEWFPHIKDGWVSVFWEQKKRQYENKKSNKHTMKYEDECLKLEIMEVSPTEVEIFWIETKDKCKGMGSDIVNKVLDTADEMGVDVRVLPVDFDTEWSGLEPIQYLRRLREWYKSFGFKYYSPFTPELKYTHQR